jgi:hypothetical protein
VWVRGWWWWRRRWVGCTALRLDNRGLSGGGGGRWCLNRLVVPAACQDAPAGCRLHEGVSQGWQPDPARSVPTHPPPPCPTRSLGAAGLPGRPLCRRGSSSRGRSEQGQQGARRRAPRALHAREEGACGCGWLGGCGWVLVCLCGVFLPSFRTAFLLASLPCAPPPPTTTTRTDLPPPTPPHTPTPHPPALNQSIRSPSRAPAARPTSPTTSAAQR